MSGCVREPELEAALDGRLDADAARKVMLHARGCMRCREAQASLERLSALARALPPEHPDGVRARRVRGAILGRALMGSTARTNRAAFGWAAVAAAAVLLVGVGRWVSHANRTVASHAVTTTVTGRGHSSDPRQVDLAGAGTLWSAPDATVLVRSMGHDTRIELWQGEITMQVNRRRAGERFVVQLSDAEVEVHGTRFAVVARAGHLVRVDVTEGVVAVRHTGDPERFLTAGAHLLVSSEQLASVDAQTPSAPPAPAAPTPPPTSRATPSAPPAPFVSSSPARPTVDPGVRFREGSLAFARGDHAAADRALGRFLSASAPHDPRREDARYLRVLSLAALGQVDALQREASAYGREFPAGVRRAEVVLATVRALASSGRCAEATQAAASMPDGAPSRVRAALADALRCGSVR